MNSEKRLRTLAFATLTLAVLVAAGDARAGILITLEQVGLNVDETGNGQIDLTGLKFDGTADPDSYGMNPSVGFVNLRSADHHVDVYTASSGPSHFGSGGLVGTSTSSGSIFGLDGSVRYIFVPLGYTSGTTISNTCSFDNSTFASLGLTEGTYTYTWGTGGADHTLTVQIGPAAVPEPSTAILALTGAVASLPTVGPAIAGISDGRFPPSNPSRTRDRATRPTAPMHIPSPGSRRPLHAHHSHRRTYAPMWIRSTPRE